MTRRCKCSVYGCNSASYNEKHKDLTFHVFPRNPEMNKKWVDACKSSNLSNIPEENTKKGICSLHFEKKYFYFIKRRNGNIFTRLNEKAVPTLHLPKYRFGSAKSSQSQCTTYKISSSSDSEDDDPIEIQSDETDTILENSQSSKTASKQTNKIAEETDTGNNSYRRKVTPANMESSKAADTELDLEDDSSTFAAHLKTRMRSFDPQQKCIAQKLISDVMFMAETKQLQLTSEVVNRPAQQRRPLPK